MQIVKPIKLRRKHLLLTTMLCLAAGAGAWLYNRPAYPGDVKGFPGLYGGFHYEHWMDISNKPVYSNNGTYRINQGILRLFPNHSITNNGHHELEMETTYYPVRWGKRHYLISSDDMLPFCNSINEGTHYEYDSMRSDFIHTGDEDLPHEAHLPEVPKEWRKYLTTKVISGRVTKIIDSQTATVDIGTADGLQPGMTLSEQNRHSEIVVTQCSAKSATVRLLEPNVHSKVWFTPGTKMVSREPWRHEEISE